MITVYWSQFWAESARLWAGRRLPAPLPKHAGVGQPAQVQEQMELHAATLNPQRSTACEVCHLKAVHPAGLYKIIQKQQSLIRKIAQIVFVMGSTNF